MAEEGDVVVEFKEVSCSMYKMYIRNQTLEQGKLERLPFIVQENFIMRRKALLLVVVVRK